MKFQKSNSIIIILKFVIIRESFYHFAKEVRQKITKYTPIAVAVLR